MLFRRPVRSDLAACASLAAGLFVALSLFGHDAGTGHPPRPSSHLLGPLGDAIGKSLTDALGFAAYLLLAIWFVVVVMLFMRRSWLTWSLRLAGWLLLLPCAAILADIIGPELLGGPIAGPGGSLGAWLARWLAAELHPVGRAIVLGRSTLLGLVLALDFALAGVTRIMLRALSPTGIAAWRGTRWTLARGWSSARWFAAPEPKHDDTATDTANVAVNTPVHLAANDSIPIHHHGETAQDSPAIRVDGPAPMLPINRHAPLPD